MVIKCQNFDLESTTFMRCIILTRYVSSGSRDDTARPSARDVWDLRGFVDTQKPQALFAMLSCVE